MIEVGFLEQRLFTFQGFLRKEVVTISEHEGSGLERIEGHPRLLIDHLGGFTAFLPPKNQSESY